MRREPLERGLVEDRVVGAGRRQQRLDSRRLAPELIERQMSRDERSASARSLLGRAIHDREVEPGLREGERRALGHRRDAHERNAARRSRDPFAQELHGDLRERYAALAELRLAAHPRSDSERFLEYPPQARAAKAELERALLRGANLSHDLGLADARGVEAGRGQKKMLGRSLAVPCAQAPLRLAVDGGAAGQQRERGRAQILRRRAVAASEISSTRLQVER